MLMVLSLLKSLEPSILAPKDFGVLEEAFRGLSYVKSGITGSFRTTRTMANHHFDYQWDLIGIPLGPSWHPCKRKVGLKMAGVNILSHVISLKVCAFCWSLSLKSSQKVANYFLVFLVPSIVLVAPHFHKFRKFNCSCWSQCAWVLKNVMPGQIKNVPSLSI